MARLEKKMLRNTSFAIVFLVIFCAFSALAAEISRSDELFSPSVADKFHKLAYDLINDANAAPPQREQALILLESTLKLDRGAKYALADMIRAACQYDQTNRSELVFQLLRNYVSESANLDVMRTAVTYLLEQLNSREEREALLAGLLRSFGGKSKVLASELATQIGLLAAEKADAQSAIYYFAQAYTLNKYNVLAFEKLAELAPEQINAAVYLEHYRFALQENPLDMGRALVFARACEKMQLYATAAATYQYCTDLFGYLNPGESLPGWIYLPWALSNYNTPRSEQKCLQIVSTIRETGRFDLMLEAIAGKAAEKLGNTEEAKKILDAAADKAQGLLSAGTAEQAQVTAEQLGWFYSFVQPEPDKALDWANKAYSEEPNSAGAILAYALVMNGQTDLAQTVIEGTEDGQIASLVKAEIELAGQQKEAAIETFKAAIEKDPGSLVAEKARETLAAAGGSYVPAFDPDILLKALEGSFGNSLEPSFMPPERTLSVQLNTRGGKFAYDSDFGGNLTIKNNMPGPLVVSDDGLFNGYVRVDANVTGDMTAVIPNLFSQRIVPASPIEPNRTISIDVPLISGKLRELLLKTPQASLEIEFTVYLDPVITSEGALVNRISALEPTELKISRGGVELTAKFLQNQFESLSRGQQGQKVRSGRLFAGLLKEQQMMANRDPLYKFLYQDWMPTLLKSAVKTNLADDDWVVKVLEMDAIRSLPLDYELTNAVAENLYDQRWPVRMMAVYLLAKGPDGGFAKVLDSVAQQDSNQSVRNMAIALGAAATTKETPLPVK
jgi:hypothetical protein